MVQEQVAAPKQASSVDDASWWLWCGQVGSTVRDALPIFCSEAEEHSAAFLTAAHSEVPWHAFPVQIRVFAGLACLAASLPCVIQHSPDSLGKLLYGSGHMHVWMAGLWPFTYTSIS